MKNFTLLVLLIFSGVASSQNCKFQTNEVDEFTHDKILETKEGVFTVSGMGFGFSCAYSLKKINETKYLIINIYSPSIFTLKKGSEVLFMTDEDEVISLEFPKTIIADGKYNSSLNSTHWSAKMPIFITDEINKRFLNETLTKLRVYLDDGYIDDKIKKKHAKKFVKYLECIQ